MTTTENAIETASDATAEADTTADGAADALPRPRIRIGAVVWGLVVTAVAGAALLSQLTNVSRQAVVGALGALGPLTIGVGVLVLVGGGTLLIAASALVRRAQIQRGGSR